MPTALTDNQRRAIWTITQEAEKRHLLSRGLPKRGPQTDDELWRAVHELTGYRIPREAVCPGHSSPFEIFADLYFDRAFDVLMIGNRGGGKTTISGFLHGAKCRWRPGYKSLIAGATEKQAGRAYTEFGRFKRRLVAEIVDSLRSLTTWLNGSILEVITATMKGVNGPHPHLAQFDEAELSTQLIFEEFQNMAQGDDKYPAQNLLSTTRKFAFGIIQNIVKRVEEDLKEGNTPEWDIRIFCVFETMQNVPNCGEGCGCEQVVKGRWPSGHPLAGEPRSFASVCGGRAKRSQGFVRLEDVHRRFKRLSMDTWDAQQECLRPDPEGLVHRWLTMEHVLTSWYPDPALGDVFRCWDWGGTNPHAVLWCQLLQVPVEHEGRLIKEGTLVAFDEFYKGDQLSFTDLGIRVGARTQEWRECGYGFQVVADICDPAGGVAKKDAAGGMAGQGFPEPAWRNRPTPRLESIKKHVEWGQDDRLLIVGPMCPNLLDEYSKAHRPLNKDGQPLSEDMAKVDDHALDAQRMLIWHLYKEAESGPEERPISNSDPKTTRLHKRPGMRGALGHVVKAGEAHPAASAYLQQLPDFGAGFESQRSASPVASRGRHSLRRARIPR